MLTGRDDLEDARLVHVSHDVGGPAVEQPKVLVVLGPVREDRVTRVGAVARRVELQRRDITFSAGLITRFLVHFLCNVKNG